jgi:hypothetical protein
VVNRLLYCLMSCSFLFFFLLAKEEARYRQPTDVQEPTALYAAVLTGRCTGAETVACRCSDTGSSFFCRSKNYQDYIHVYSVCVQRIRTAYTTVPTVIIFCIFFLVPSVQKFGTGAASEGQKISKYTGFRRRSPIIFSALNGIRRKAKNETLPLDYLK